MQKNPMTILKCGFFSAKVQIKTVHYLQEYYCIVKTCFHTYSATVDNKELGSALNNKGLPHLIKTGAREVLTFWKERAANQDNILCAIS